MTTTRKKIDGILLLNKPIGMSSNQALQHVKRLFSAKKAGHTGSLDPLATGMLPICFGEATKFSQFLLDADKSYQVVAKLGEKTNTGDAEGSVIEKKPVGALTEETLQGMLQHFRGTIQQVPPMFSAIKCQGKPLYALARQGIEVERAARTVEIHRLTLLSFDQDTVSLEVHCSKGTYIRTLVEDIGEQLGCGAHVQALHRTMVVPFANATMYSLEALRETVSQCGVDVLSRYLLPVDASIASLPSVQLSASAIFYLRTGQAVMVPQSPAEGLVRLYSNDASFFGIGEILDDGRVAPRRLVSHS